MFYRKAEMGVGTLIIFIAMLLVAAVAAGVLIQTVSSLQEKSLSTGQQAKSQISTNAETIEVSATDGRDTIVNDFTQMMKLSPGSDPIKLDQVILTFNTKDKSSSLRYRGATGVCRLNNTTGYWTRAIETVDSAFTTTGTSPVCLTLDEDMDADGDFTDQVCLLSNGSLGGSWLQFNYSSMTTYRNVSISSITAAGSVDVDLDVSETYINPSDITLGKYALSCTATTNNQIPANCLSITPYNEGEGYFTVEYLQEATDNVAGNLQRGDLIKICYRAPQDIGEDNLVRLNFIPKIGTPTLTEFVTPDVISTERVYLYP